MADKKISELTNYTPPIGTDVLPVLDITTGITKKISYESLFIPGLISPYGGSSAPSGWLLCDGSAVSRTTYSSLYLVVGTTYGAGNGSTTFNVPNLQGRVVIGVGTGTKVATFASRSSNVITVTGISNIANNEFQTGQAVVYHTSGSVITGLTNDATYYLIRTGNLTFSLATTLALAVAGTVITLSGDGTGTQTFTLTMVANALAESGGEQKHALTTAELASHTHGVQQGSGAPGSSYWYPYGTSPIYQNVPTTATGGDTQHNNLQPYVALNYIIKC